MANANCLAEGSPCKETKSHNQTYVVTHASHIACIAVLCRQIQKPNGQLILTAAFKRAHTFIRRNAQLASWFINQAARSVCVCHVSRIPLSTTSPTSLALSSTAPEGVHLQSILLLVLCHPNVSSTGRCQVETTAARKNRTHQAWHRQVGASIR